VPETEDETGCEHSLPLGDLLGLGLDQGEQLGGVVFDLAVDL
jgi:hypothetical protein